MKTQSASAATACRRWPVLLLVLMLPAAVQAEEFAYTTNAGTITITDYTGPGGDVEIPGTINGLPVTSIGVNAFNGCTSLTRITIPNSVINIGASAFSQCTGLTRITIPGNVTSLGGFAFEDCISLTSAEILDGVVTIGSGAFSGCTSLTSIAIPQSVYEASFRLFRGCTSPHLSPVLSKTP